jgi:hypothetical protein
VIFNPSKQLYQATLFVAKPGAPSRTVFLRAASFAEAEALATKLAESLAPVVIRGGEPPLALGGILIEQPAPNDVPPMQEPRVRNGVSFMVPMRGSQS